MNRRNSRSASGWCSRSPLWSPWWRRPAIVQAMSKISAYSISVSRQDPLGASLVFSRYIFDLHFRDRSGASALSAFRLGGQLGALGGGVKGVVAHVVERADKQARRRAR